MGAQAAVALVLPHQEIVHVLLPNLAVDIGQFDYTGRRGIGDAIDRDFPPYS